MAKRRRSKRPNWPLRLAEALAVALPVGFVIYKSTEMMIREPYGDRIGYFLGFGFEAVLLVWAFTVGACIGSFINVVALRMPTGESINGDSHCPYCFGSLDRFDNIPIFGWLSLRGRCRRCRLPISSRYFWVELLVGLIFLTIGYWIVLAGSASLPPEDMSRFWPVRALFRWDWLYVYRSLYFVTFLSLLVTAGLMVGSGKNLPARFLAFAFTVLLIPPIAYPPLIVIAWKAKVLAIGPTSVPDITWYLQASVTVLCGIAMAIVVARGTAPAMFPRMDRKLLSSHPDTRSAWDWIWQFVWIGIVLGWQATLSVGIIWVTLIPLFSRLANRVAFPLTPPNTLLYAAAWIHLLLWYPLANIPFWPSHGRRIEVYVGALLLIMFSSRVLVSRKWLEDRLLSQEAANTKPLPLDSESEEDEDSESQEKRSELGEIP